MGLVTPRAALLLLILCVEAFAASDRACSQTEKNIQCENVAKGVFEKANEMIQNGTSPGFARFKGLRIVDIQDGIPLEDDDSGVECRYTALFSDLSKHVLYITVRSN